MNDIITIITPSLDQGQFIGQTIKSVLSQEGDFYIDYIISDGGSTDNSVEIIKKYDELLKTKKHPVKCKGISYRWWSEKDNGQSYAINKGFKIAKGNILAWINSDDYYEPDAFEFIMKKFKKNPEVDLVYGNGYVINEETKTRTASNNESGNIKTLLQGKYYIFQPSAFFTKKIINKIGMLDENLHYAMDYDLWIRIFKNSKTLFSSKILSNFRVWENSKTGSQQKNFSLDRKKIFKKYGGVIIDPEIIHKIRKKIPLLYYLNKKFPKLCKLCKKIFYSFALKLKYK